MNYASEVGETLRQVPTIESARTALAILLELARGGDVPAARTLGALLAQKLEYQDAVPVIENLGSVTCILQEDRIPWLLRIYLLAFIPREFISQIETAHATSDFDDKTEFKKFQRLVRRDDILRHEVLKAYCLATFVGMSSLFGINNGARGLGSFQKIIDRIASECQVVPGMAANSKFEIGRDLILESTVNRFRFILGHEMGHNVFDVHIKLTREDVAVSDEEAMTPSADEFLALTNALPDVIREALSTKHERLMPAHFVGRQITLLVSLNQVQHGSYIHWSLTMRGGPIPIRTAILWATLLLSFFRVATSDTAVAYSPRGVFHFGFARKIDPNAIVWPKHKNEVAPQLAAIQAAGDIWFEELVGAKKIGSDEISIAVELGLQDQQARIFPSGGKALDDIKILESLSRRGSVSLSKEQAQNLMGVAMRCAYPTLIKSLLDSGVRPEEYLSKLGSSIGVAAPPDQSAKEYFGPTAENIIAVFSWLHKQGVDLDTALDETGTTLLHDAVRQESVGVSVLLALGADPNLADANGNTALHLAIGSSQRNLVERVLQAGAEYDRRNAQGQTALALAAAIDDVDAVDLLLQVGADPDTRDAAGATPLMSALSSIVVRRLTASGADPNAVDHSARTPLMAAAQSERAEIVRALLDDGADPEQPDDLGYTALHFAAGNLGEATEDCLKALLDAGSEVDEETRDGMTPLMVSAQLGCVDAVRVLLSRGADVNARSQGGNTPLILALDPSQQLSRNPARTSHTEEVVRALAESGADLNAQNDSGLSALHFAALVFTSSLGRTLLELGAEVDLMSQEGQTPLMYAVAQGHDDMVKALIDAGADVNARDAKGNTPLHIAAGNDEEGLSEKEQKLIGQLKARGACE
jgi:ankyrin repeat protein